MTSTEKKVGDGTSVEVFTTPGVEGGPDFEVSRVTDGTNIAVVHEHPVDTAAGALALGATVSVHTPDPHQRNYLAWNDGFTLVHGAAIRIGALCTSGDVKIDWGAVIDLAGGKVDPDYKVNGEPQGALVGEFTDNDDPAIVHEVYMERYTERFYFYKDSPERTTDLSPAKG
jgi:hypothetical protein